MESTRPQGPQGPQGPLSASGRSTGTEARSAVEDVLRDQAEKAERRQRATPQPRKPGPALGVVALLLAVATVWALRAPPAFLQPPPPPAPPPEVQEAGLRMSVYVATLRIDAFSEAHRRLPVGLTEVFEGPEDLEGLTYEPLDQGRYRLSAARDGHVLVFETGDDIAGLAGGARRVLEHGR